MKLIELTETDFTSFASIHPLANFHQTTSWGTLKQKNGWTPYYIGLEDNNKIVAAALLLSKKTPIKKNMFYSPRGFLIDYKDFHLLETFTKEIKNYAKKKNAIFIKIDPYLDYIERDIDGNIVENGIDNSQAVENLKQLGYQHFGFNLMQESLQPRWIYTIPTKNKTEEMLLNEMDRETRRIIKKNEQLGLKIREININELDKFKAIMSHTSDRRDFIDRPFEYYKNMWETLHETNMIKVLLAELNTEEYLTNLTVEKEKIETELQDRTNKKEHGILKMNEKKYEQKNKDDTIYIQKLTKKIEEIKKAQETHGSTLILGGVLFLIYGNEVVALVGGSYKDFIDFKAPISIYWEMIKYAANNNLDRYNFYGITGDFNKTNPLYGLYLFKRGFGGKVNELIGEFDLIINRPLYRLYKLSFKIYKKIKNKKGQ